MPKISTWLYRVTHNLSIDAIRRRERQNLAATDMTEIEDTSTNQTGMRHKQDVTNQVEAAISSLPERQRTAITLVHHRDLSNKEAASIMDISVDALESLLARGRKGLRKLLEDQREDLLGVQI
ncbi:sigma-70 family RNA polymerase sigma factor [Kiloniella sp.]|uniref:sigma-70 family RNA polymerase sigma factor n=1 Tax=Kiloniella sp. TaxID=1938587 RepID=UPI003B0199A1